MADPFGNTRRLARGRALTVGVIVVVAALIAPAMAQAATEPYVSDGEGTSCEQGERSSCEVAAAADAATGTIVASSAIVAPPLTGAGGRAQAWGLIHDSARVSKKARSVRVSATVLVRSADAGLFSPTPSSGEGAHVTLQLLVALPCGRCGGGSLNREIETRVVDTDSVTPEPASLAGVTRTLTAEIALGAGESFSGGGTVSVKGWTYAFLATALAAVERRASAAGDFDVLSIDVTAS